MLLVDDDRDTREMYSLYLRHVGLRVDEAPSAWSALDRAREMAPDVIVTDIAMPGMDGVMLSRALKAEAATRHVPIIAVSGNADRAQGAGCDAVLEKPCSPDRLLQAIENVLDRQRT